MRLLELRGDARLHRVVPVPLLGVPLAILQPRDVLAQPLEFGRSRRFPRAQSHHGQRRDGDGGDEEQGGGFQHAPTVPPASHDASGARGWWELWR